MARLAALRADRHWWMATYLAWMATLGAAYFAWTGMPLVALIGISSAAAIVVGIAANRPPQRTPWVLLAGAVLANAAARVAFMQLGRSGPFDESLSRLAPMFVLHLVMTVLLTGALISFAWPHVHVRQLSTLIDVGIVALAAGLMAWLVIAQPWTAAANLPTPQVVARIAYALRDVLFLAAAARLIAVVRWNSSVGLLTLGTAGLLVYDTLFRIGLVRGDWSLGSPIEIGWLTFYAAAGAAALVPSMATITTPADQPRDESGPAPLVLIAISAVIPFSFVVRDSLRGQTGTPAVIALTSAAMLALILGRLTLAAIQLRRSRSEAIIVRDAATELVAASDLPAIEAAVSTAISQLLRPGVAFSVRRVGDHEPDPPPGQAELRIALDAADDASGATPVALLVRAPAEALSSLRSPLEAIAAQVRLALARLDLTEQVINNRSDQYFRALVQNATDVIIIVDDQIRVRYASPSSHRMFGTSDLHGQPLPALLAPSDRHDAYELFNAKCRDTDVSGPGRSEAEHWVGEAVRADWRLDGPEPRWVEMSCLDLRGEDAIRGFLVTLREVTERRRLEDKLTMLAFHDSLTGLSNRALFTAKVAAAVANTAHTDTAAAVLVVDLDNFKVVNDGYGHVVGDAYLKEVGERLTAVIGPTGIASRIGGDEFAVLLQGTDAVTTADHVAGSITTAFGKQTNVDGHDIMCSVSVGVATTHDARSAHDLLRHADLALYEAKASGKQQWHHYDPTMTTAIMDRLELQAALSEALETAALRIEYQPIVALESGRTVGFEALLRWEHPTRGRLGPGEFIDAAEESGLIVPIGEWILGSAIHEATRWARRAPGSPPYVSVNVSVKQFRTQDMFAIVERKLREGGLPPDLLLLEITESLLLHDDSTVIDSLRRLRHLGVRIAIDDFGTGYSALGYLQRVPMDVLKLDRIFTNTMSHSEQQRHIVASIVQLAETLDLEIIAEGIETMEEYGLARQTGCGFGQGYLFSRPLPPADAMNWVTDDGPARRRTDARRDRGNPARGQPPSDPSATSTSLDP